MRFFTLPTRVLVLFVFLLAVVAPSRADKMPIRGGSTYGDNAGLAGCQAKIDAFVADNNNLDNCEGFSAGVFTIGGNSYGGALFAFLEPGGTAFGTLDIIELSGNSSLTLTLLNSALPTGVFMCGSFDTDRTVAQDSTLTDMTGLPCTAGSSSGGYFNASQEVANVQATFSATGVTFVNGNSTGIVLFAEDGNIEGATFASTTATPEPGSLMLLGIGLLALGRKFRRTD
jgi:hypothetical protein